LFYLDTIKLLRGESWDHINWIKPPHYCTSLKPGYGYPPSCVMVSSNVQWFENRCNC